MRIFGLTGNTGSGKTTVARLLAALGAGVVDADVLARLAVESGSPGLKEISQTFGAQYIDEDGNLRRQLLGRLVFSDPAAKATLEAITHPRIAQLAQAQFEALASRKFEVAIYDSAILVETGLYRALDGLIVVTAPEDIRLSRIQGRDSLSDSDARLRMRAQMPIEEKLAVADFTIDNAGSVKDLEQLVEELWLDLLKV